MDNKLDEKKVHSNYEQKISIKARWSERKEGIKKFGKAFLTKEKWRGVGIGSAKQLDRNKLLIVIVIFCIVIGSMNSSFWSPENWKNIFANYAYMGVIGLGMCMIILTGGIDLSAGSLAGLSAAVTINLINNNHMNGNLAIFISLLVGAAVGLLNGFCVAVLKLQPFIVTLAGMMLFRGLIYVATSNHMIQTTNNVINYWGSTMWANFHMQAWVFIILLVVFLFILKFTVYGRNIYATGSNEVAARLSGVRTKVVIASVYVIGGMLAALAGNMIMSFTGSATPSTSGLGFELQAVAAVVLGGTSLLGGVGGVFRASIGWLVLTVIQNALFAIGYDMNVQQVFSGIIVLLAVALERDYGVINKLKYYYNNKSEIKQGFKHIFIRKKD